MRDWLQARLEHLLRKGTGAREFAKTTDSAPGDTGNAVQRPQDPWALYHAGFVEQAMQEALGRLQAEPTDNLALMVIAAIDLDRGQVDKAVRILEKQAEAAPENAGVWALLGRAWAAAKQRKKALAALTRAVELKRDHGEARAELAVLLLAAGQVNDAVPHMALANGHGARIAEAHYRFAESLLQGGQHDAALNHLRRAIAAHPEHAHAHADLGAMLRDRHQPKDAEHHLQQALRGSPVPEAAYNLAMLRIEQHRWQEAVLLLREYLAAVPKDADALYWLGNALMGQGNADAARGSYQDVLRRRPQHVQARWGWVMAQLAPLPQDDAAQQAASAAFSSELEKLRTWFRSNPGVAGWGAVGSQQPFYLAYVPGNHREVLVRYGQLCSTLMSGWARKVGVPQPAAAASSRLKVGIVSAHIHAHSVWHAVLKGWLRHLDPRQFELHVYHVGRTRDLETEWARRHAMLHHDVGDWTDWAKVISDAKLDTLIYPEIGMDATTVRLASLRLARLQVAGWGHPLTTGLPTIDAYVSAEAFEPAGAASHYTEAVLALPGLGCAYQPYGTIPQPPDLASLGVDPQDRILLSAGVAFKYAPRDDVLWVDIARRCSPCKLLFFGAEGDLLATLLEQRLRKAFEAGGVDFDRHVRFVPWQSQARFFGLLQRADALLDTVGFSGFNTVMQAVECGTPVVAWEGEFMRGRFASAILHQMGLRDWIASSHEGYAECVQRLCDSPQKRQEVRQAIAARRGALYNDSSSVAALAAHLRRLAV